MLVGAPYRVVVDSLCPTCSYDADKNSEPTSATGGLKAHWAVIKGFIAPLKLTTKGLPLPRELSNTSLFPDELRFWYSGASTTSPMDFKVRVCSITCVGY
jgi:hypothetical protein